MTPLQVQSSDALLVIDMQTDFLPGGPLAVPGSDAIVPGINALARRFEHVILTQDWHPVGHISFASTHPGKQPFRDTTEASYGTQALWPEHCLQNSAGAALAPGLDIPHAELILRKGFRYGIDSYSAFVENDKTTSTGLAGYLRERGLRRLFFCGLASDFCVGHSAIDAVRLGFEAFVVEDLTRAVDLPATDTAPGSVASIEARLAAEHVVRLPLRSVGTAPGRRPLMPPDRSDWPEAMATVLSCHYETRAGRALAFGLPSSQHFHITYNYWAAGELREADFYAGKAMPQGTLFPIRYDPEMPLRNHHGLSGPQGNAVPLLALGIAGSVALSLAWLLVMRGCS